MSRLGGVLLVVVSAVGFATLAIFGRFAFADGMDALTILFLRFTLAALLLLALLWLRRQPLPRGSALLRLAGMGAVGYVGQAFCYLTALKYASAGLVALLLYLYPVFVALLAALVLHERLTRLKALALCIALAGTALTVGPAGGELAGILLAVGAAAIYSVYIIIGTGVLKEVSALQSSAVIFASAGLSSGGLMLLSGVHPPATAAGWWAVIAIVLFATVVPVVTFLAGLERVGPTNAAMLSTMEPAVTVLMAAWWLDEALEPLTLLGGGLILAAVFILARGEVRHG